MKPLPDTFRKDGYNFVQVFREGRVAVFSKSKSGHRWPSFETVIIQENKARTIAGVNIPASESLPRSEDWGWKGWSFTTFDEAFRKAQEVAR